MLSYFDTHTVKTIVSDAWSVAAVTGMEPADIICDQINAEVMALVPTYQPWKRASEVIPQAVLHPAQFCTVCGEVVAPGERWAGVTVRGWAVRRNLHMQCN